MESIAEARNVGHNKQADKILKIIKILKKYKKAINGFKVGDLVLVATEAVDRGAADARNLLCYIV